MTRLYCLRDFPPELTLPCDHLLRAKATCQQEHMIQIANLARDRISLGRQARAEMFDGEKLRAGGVHVDRTSFSGAGMYIGSEDVLYSVHVNREALADPDRPAAAVAAEVTGKVRAALAALGIETAVTGGGRKRQNGVCLDLDGRGEITARDGRKLVATVYRDDGLVVTLHGAILVTDAWTRIYGYLRDAPPPAKAAALRDLAPGLETAAVIAALKAAFGEAAAAAYTPAETRAMRRLAPQFEAGRWQG